MSEPGDRNLKLAVLGLRLGLLDADTLLEAIEPRPGDEARPLEDRLVARGVLDPVARETLVAMLDRPLLGLDQADLTLAVPPTIAPVEAAVDLGTLDALPLDINVDQTYATRIPYEATDESRPAGSAEVPFGAPRYRRLRGHARGNLGEVFVAFDEELRREVALKEMQERIADDPGSRDRFCFEAEVTGGLEHPGIVPVYGLGQYEDGRPYYAMRFIRGNSLAVEIAAYHALKITEGRDRARESALRKLLGRFIDVCQAIAYAHSRGVIHRDLKPNNIMVGKYGETLVVDWGLARPINADPSEGQAIRSDEPALQAGSGSHQGTVAGSVVGTPAFMPPEQAAGRLDLLGPWSDVYSLGATLYQILTGRTAFEAGPGKDLLVDVQKGDFPAPRDLDPSIPRALEAIALKAMATRPEDRHPTPLALAADLEHWLADEPTSALVESRAERAARWARHHRSASMAAAATLLAVSVVATASALIISSARHKTTEALTKQTQATQDTYRALRLARLANEAETQAKTKAQDEAEKANGVADFLTGLFQETDPVAATGRNFGFTRAGGQATAREIIDRGAEAIAKKLKDRPLVRAAVLESIGNAYVGLGESELAGRYLAESLEIRERLLPADDLELASSLHTLGWAREVQFDPSSVPLLERALAIRRARLGPDDPRVAASMFHLAMALQAIDQTYDDRVRKLLDESLAIRRRSLGSDSREVAIQLISMGAISSMRDRPMEAAPLYLEAVKIALSNGETRVATMLTAFVKAEGTERLIGTRRALPAFASCLESARLAFGPDHFVAGHFARIYAEKLLLAGEPARAAEHFREFLAIFRKLRAPNQTLAGPTMHLARAIRDTGDQTQAEKIAREALDLVRNSRKTSNTLSIQSQTCFVLGILIMNRDHLSTEAHQLLEESLAIRREVFGSNEMIVGHTLEVLGWCDELQGRVTEAVAAIEEALAIARRHPGDNAPWIAQAQAILARHPTP